MASMNVEVASSTDLLTTSDFARRADRTPDTVRHWERTGLIHALKTASGQRLFRREDVERFLAARRDRG